MMMEDWSYKNIYPYKINSKTVICLLNYTIHRQTLRYAICDGWWLTSKVKHWLLHFQLSEVLIPLWMYCRIKWYNGLWIPSAADNHGRTWGDLSQAPSLWKLSYLWRRMWWRPLRKLWVLLGRMHWGNQSHKIQGIHTELETYYRCVLATQV